MVIQHIEKPDPADQGKGEAGHDDHHLRHAVKVEVEEDEDDHQGERDDHTQGAAGFLHILELARPDDGVALGQLDAAVDDGHRLAYVRTDIDALQVDVNPGRLARVFALDAGRPFANGEIGKLGQRHLRAGARRHQYPFEPVDVVAQFSAVAQVDGIALQPFDGKGDVHAADGRHDHLLHVCHRQSVAGDLGAVDDEVQVIATGDALGINGKRAGDVPHDRLNPRAEVGEHIEVGAHQLDADGGFDAGGEHVDAGLDRHGPGVRQAGKADGAVEVVRQFVHGQIPLLGPNPSEGLLKPAWPT